MTDREKEEAIRAMDRATERLRSLDQTITQMENMCIYLACAPRKWRLQSVATMLHVSQAEVLRRYRRMMEDNRK